MTSTQSPIPSDLPTTDGTAELIGYGRVSWPQLTALLTGSQTAWADYNGFHIGPPPATPPPYTHLWAWTDQWLTRARLDADTAIVGVLALKGELPSAPPVQLREPVHFRHTQAQTWSPTEKRVGRQPDHVAGRPMDIYLIPGEHPITFVAARDDQPQHSGNQKLT